MGCKNLRDKFCNVHIELDGDYQEYLVIHTIVLHVVS